jgi:POT family proton-dependent oligopeptide transporter
MVAVGFLVLAYLLHTTGELCLSPVGLAMITRLSPAKLVSTMMGMWFLATAFSNFLASLIASATGVQEEGDGKTLPVPQDTLTIYSEVFLKVGIAAGCCAAACFLLVPILKKWMHDEANPRAGH